MGIEVRTAAYGPDATAALAGLLEELRGGDPLAPATVLVPTNFVAVAARRALAWQSAHGLAGVSFSTIYRLAELLGAPALASGGRRPVSTPVVGAAIRAVLEDDAGVFELTKEHPATGKALLAAHRELSDLNAQQLSALAAQSPKAGDVVRIHREVDVRLSSRWYSEQDLLSAAAHAIDAAVPALGGVGPVVLYLPGQITAGQLALLERLGATRSVVMLVGTTGDPEIDGAVLEGLGASAELERAHIPVGDRIVSVSDADDEVRTTLRQVVDASRRGVPFDKMALLYASEQPYARLLHEQLTAAGVPYNGAALGTLSESLVGRTALGLLSLRDRDYHRSDLLSLLNSAPIRDRGRLVPVAAWERLSRAAGVVRGAAQWDQRLQVLIGDRRADLDALVGDPDESWRIPGIEREISRAEGLWTFVAKLIAELQKADRRATWTQRCRWLRTLLGRYLGGEGVRGRWPETERDAAERIEALLERLEGLDEIESSPSLAVFTRTLELEFEGGLGRRGRFGEGVLVGGLHMATGLDLEEVWILGTAEGLLPSRPRDDSLLPDRERAVTDGALRTRRQRLADQRRHYLAALAAAASRTTLMFPRGDLRRSNERMPSRWLLEAAGRHEGRRVFSPDLAGLAGRDWFTESASHVAGLLGSVRPPTLHEYDVVSVLEARGGSSISTSRLALTDQAFQRGLELLAARRSRDFTRFDGNLAGLDVASPTDPDRVVSPTRLEAWAVCPHAYLMRYVLGVQPTETPEAIFALGALERGTLIHSALDKWLREVLEEGDRGAPWSDAQRSRLLHLARAECRHFEERGLVGGRVRWRFDQRAILADLSEFIDQDNVRRATSGMHALASEMDFGLQRSERSALEFPLTDGRELRFRGSADRVDRDADGQLLVVDYKTGSDYAFTRLSESNPDLAGTKLQLPVYAAAARQAYGDPETPVRAAYWFVTAKRKFKLIELPLTEAVAERVDSVLGTIADGISDGVFPEHPEKEGFSLFTACSYCDPDDLGTRDKRRDWERKAVGPLLRPYLRLADPDLAAAYDSGEVAS